MSSLVATSPSTTNSATSLSTGSNVNLNVQPQQQQQQQQQLSAPPSSQMHITNLILPATNAIRKRKVKFTVQLGIQELLSVPYLNGVLFCKVRLCNGGNHVSYSSKKEISNSSVIWTNDSAIQFDVKVVQLYSVTNLNLTTTSSSVSSSITPGVSQMPATTTQQIYVIGYEPCLCRISVRKELRGGKSYQKLGYVDYNLSDFILKYQQDSTAAMSSTDTSNIEYCVNRILKEYDTQQAKKNQQRLDNSFLKIKIRINESSVVIKPPPATPVNSSIGLKMNKNDQIDSGNVDTDLKRSEKVSSTSMSTSASSSISSSLNNVNIDPSNDPKKNKTIKSSGNELNAALSPVPLSSSSASHMRNMSSVSNSGLSASFNSNNSPNLMPHLINTYGPGHNRSCSNGSIKSNVSFDFMIKNKNKFLEDAPTTSTSSLATNSGRMMNHQSIDSGTLKPSFNTPSIPVPTAAQMINTSYSNLIQNSKPESANTRIIESRLDANEIINAIELELSNQIQQNGKYN